MRKSRDVIDEVTPVKDASLTPSTRGSLQWFQQKKQQWKQSPRNRIVALPPSPDPHQAVSSTKVKESLSKPSTVPRPNAPTFSSPSLPSGGFSFQNSAATPKSLFPPPNTTIQKASPLPKPISGFSFPAPTMALKPPLGNTPAKQQPTPSFSFGVAPPSTATRSAPAVTSSTTTSTKAPSPGVTFSFAASTQPTIITYQQQQQQQSMPPKREPAAPSNITPVAEPTSHRERLLQFYQKHNPSKIDSVDATLASYRGKEEVLFKKLEEKYVSGKDGMLPPSGTGPSCFLDFSVDGTSSGRVVVKLYQDKAPLACENFRSLCTGEKGQGRSTKDLCYRGSRVHRIVPNFCVQMGDFTKGDGTGGESIYPPSSEHGDMWGKFKDETPFLMHARKGLLSMANNGPNKNGSQFFITLKAIPHLDGKHVVFGEVVSGMEVVEQMGKLETDKKQRPLAPVVIEGCGQLGDDGKEIQAGTSAAKSFAATTSQPFGFGTTSSAFGSSNATSNQQSSFATTGASLATPSTPFSTFSLQDSRNNAPATATSSSSVFGKPFQPTVKESKSLFNFGPSKNLGDSDAAASTTATDIQTKPAYSFAFGGGETDKSSTADYFSSFSSSADGKVSKYSPFSFGQGALASGTLDAATNTKTAASNTTSTTAVSKETSSKPSELIANSSVFGQTPAIAPFGAPENKSMTSTASSSFSFGKAAEQSESKSESIDADKPNASKSLFSFGAPKHDAADTASSVPKFSFGMAANQSEPKSEGKDASNSDAQKSAFSLGAPQHDASATKTAVRTFSFGNVTDQKEAADTKAAVPAFSFGPVSSAQPAQPSSALTFSFGAPTTESGKSQPKGSTEATKPTLPSFYFGKEKSGALSSGAPKALEKPTEATQVAPSGAGEIKVSTAASAPAAPKPSTVDGSKESSLPEASSREPSSTVPSASAVISTGAATSNKTKEDVSFASFSPHFMGSSKDSDKSKGDDEATISTEGATDAVCQTPSTPAKSRQDRDIGFQSGVLETITPKQNNTRVCKTETKPARPRGMQRGFYSTPSRKQPRDISEAVADILAERVFSDDNLLSEVSVEAVEKVMALPVEMMIAVLERIDKIESRGESFTWSDIQDAISTSQGAVKALNFDDQSFTSYEDFKSCVSMLTAAQDRHANTEEDDLSLSARGSFMNEDDAALEVVARDTDRSRSEKQQPMKSERKEGGKEPEELELLIQNLEFLN